MKFRRPPTPGAGRLTLAALLVVSMVFDWRYLEPAQRWWLIPVGALVVFVLGWWRGVHLTTLAGRRLAMLWRNVTGGSKQAAVEKPSAVTVVLRVDGPDGELPSTLADYLHRFGVRCSKVRFTEHSSSGQRTAYVSLTVDAVDNLAALQARSADLPLHETATVVARRLADELGERGWRAQIVDADEVPAPPAAGKERWRGVADGGAYVAAYRVATAGRLDETLAGVRSAQAQEAWAAVEYTGDPGHPDVVAGAALRTPDLPGRAAPDGLTPHAGVHREALAALSPRSTALLVP